MPNWRTLIEKDHLGSWDLVGDDGKPRDYTLEIAKVESVSLKTKSTPKGKRKVVITFVDKRVRPERPRKKFVANSTNCETIEGLYGPLTEHWIGKRITLYQTDVRSPDGKGTVKGIRVRPSMPKGPAEEVPERDVDPEMRAAQDEAFGREPGEEG